jgi:hypothetical protein
MDRIASCVNGCDAAGIVDPSGLANFLELAQALHDQWPALAPQGRHDAVSRIGAALRAVRGE